MARAAPRRGCNAANRSPALRTDPGARFWRIELLEFAGGPDGSGEIIALGDGGSAQRSIDSVPSDITIDRVYITSLTHIKQWKARARSAAASPISVQRRKDDLSSITTNATR